MTSSSGSADVLTRLDSLLLNNSVTANDHASPKADNKAVVAASCGILKSARSNSKTTDSKKNRIRFPDNEDMHEIIGYGGDMNHLSSEDDEDDEDSFLISKSRVKKSYSSSDEELTAEEKEIISLTKKNTSFNARSINLCDPDQRPKFGASSKDRVTPLVTVRPFVREHSTPGKVNKVSPMVNGEVVEQRQKETEDGDVVKVTSFGTKDAKTVVEKTSSDNSQTGGDEKITIDSSPSPSSTSSGSGGVETISSSQSIATARANFLSNMKVGSNNENGDEKSDEEINDRDHLSEENEVTKADDADMDDSEGKEQCGTENGQDPPKQVKLTRKSPYVSSSAILKGTPKPTVVVKKPPVPREKPKIPEKPRALKMNGTHHNSSPAQSSGGNKKKMAPGIPVTARTNNTQNEVTISASSKIEMMTHDTKPVTMVAESYSSEADTQNEVIFEVNATRSKPSNREAIEEIRKSLEEDNKKPIESASFAERRASIANSLHPSSSAPMLSNPRASTKRKAPKPPVDSNAVTSSTFAPTTSTSTSTTASETNTKATSSDSSTTDTNDSCAAIEEGNKGEKGLLKKNEQEMGEEEEEEVKEREEAKASANCQRETTDSQATNATTTTITTTSTTTTTNKPKNHVQFKDLPLHKELQSTIEPISYNRWIGRNTSGVIESSFTGQPIVAKSSPKPFNVNGAIVTTSTPIRDDEVRKWTEKKRSRSVQPRGSEIDEILGSSKIKPRSRFMNAVSTVNGALDQASASLMSRRSARLDNYEQERKMSKNNSNRFSFSKILKQFTSGVGSSQDDVPATSHHKFMDAEHEREIVERERSKLRPNIIHPLDFNATGAVEVVPIIPKPAQGQQQQHVFEKHAKASSAFRAGAATKSILKAKVEYTDSKDSGHETSSIHTENSDSSSSSDVHSRTPSSLEESSISQVVQDDHMTNIDQIVVRPPTAVKLNGRLKPLPPPRSHSLENFDSSSSSNGSCFGEDSGVSPGSPVPPPGYVVAGKMNIGHVAVPAVNSSNLRSSTSTTLTTRTSTTPTTSAKEVVQQRDSMTTDPVPAARRSSRSSTENSTSDNYEAVAAANLKVLDQLLSQVLRPHDLITKSFVEANGASFKLEELSPDLLLWYPLAERLKVAKGQLGSHTVTLVKSSQPIRVNGVKHLAEFQDQYASSSSFIVVLAGECDFVDVTSIQDNDLNTQCFLVSGLIDYLAGSPVEEAAISETFLAERVFAVRGPDFVKLVVIDAEASKAIDTEMKVRYCDVVKRFVNRVSGGQESELKRVFEKGQIIDLSTAKRVVQCLAFAPRDISNEDQTRHWLHLRRASVLNQILLEQGLHDVRLNEMDTAELEFLISIDAHSLAETMKTAGLLL